MKVKAKDLYLNTIKDSKELCVSEELQNTSRTCALRRSLARKIYPKLRTGS